MGYQPSLDGIRAIAVVAVLLYHADVRWLPGGFLGVDVFFVVSGYLITSLLRRGAAGVDDDRPQAVLAAAGQAAAARAVRHAGRDLRLRRGRGAGRALPAAHRRPRRRDVLDQLVADRRASRATSRRWAGRRCCATCGRSRSRSSGTCCGRWCSCWRWDSCGGGPSAWSCRSCSPPWRPTVWMAIVFDPSGDASRAYFGTDTRASGLLIGAAAAMVWTPWRWPWAGRRRLAGLDAIGWLALLSLVAVHAPVGPDHERALPRRLPAGLRALDRGGGRLRPPGAPRPSGPRSRWRRCAGSGRAATGCTCGTGPSSW